MRRIEIIQIEWPDLASNYLERKKYSVYLGNESRNSFNSLKDAKKFLAETNRFLNNRLHELNYLYGNIYQEYRKAWFYFESDKSIEISLIDIFQGIDKSFVLAVNKCRGSNGNHFTFKHLIYICKNLKDIALKLRKLMINRKYYVEVQRLEMFIKALKNVDFELNSYGKGSLQIEPNTLDFL